MDPEYPKKSKKRKRDKLSHSNGHNEEGPVASTSLLKNESIPSKPKSNWKVKSNFADIHKPQKPSAVAKATTGRAYTVSIALPGSILLNAQSPELRTHLAGQIARACSIFSVDEIVVFHEPNHVAAESIPSAKRQRGKYRQVATEGGADDENDMDALLCRVLQYLETPQYLRRALVPMHPSLRLAGLLPPLDMPHHLRRTDHAPFREGVVVDTPVQQQHIFGGRHDGSWIDVGLDEPVWVPDNVKVGSRVTVRMDVKSSLIDSSIPKSEQGFYWGYRVRQAASISKVMLECPFEGGYDLTLGTSERGRDISEAFGRLKQFNHALVVFGGLAGLELTIEADKALGLSAEEADAAFDHWLNVCPNQGSRTIRTEEALMISLARLKTTFETRGIS